MTTTRTGVGKDGTEYDNMGARERRIRGRRNVGKAATFQYESFEVLSVFVSAKQLKTI